MVAALAMLVGFHAQCLAMCAVQPCHPQARESGSKDSRPAPCHQDPASQGSDEQSACSHDNLTADAAKKSAAGHESPAFAIVLISQDRIAFHDLRANPSPRSFVTPLMAMGFSTVLRI